MPGMRRTSAPLIASAADALAEVMELLVGLPPSPHARALRAKADSYQQVVDRWLSISPTGPQHAALLELVSELRGQVQAALESNGEDPPPSSVRVSDPPPSSRVARITLKPSSG